MFLILGEDAEEVRIVPVLLAWLCCELRLGAPGPSRSGVRRFRGPNEQDLTHRVVWLSVFPHLDEDQWDRLLETVIASDSSPDALDWYEDARRSADHLKTVFEDPRQFLSTREGAEPGDLAWFGAQVLRVIHKDIGGPKRQRKVQWLKPGLPMNTATFDRGLVLRPDAWVPKP